MGLYDGQIGGDGFASTAHVAAVTRTPVVLVVDISPASRTDRRHRPRAATFDPDGRRRRRDPQQGRLAAARRRGRARARGDRRPGARRPASATPASRRRRATSGWCPPPSATTRPRRSTGSPGRSPSSRPRRGRRSRVAPAARRPGPRRVEPWAPGAARPGRRTRRARDVASTSGGRLGSPSPAGAPSPSATPRPSSCSGPRAARSSSFDPLTDDRAAGRARPGSTSAAASPRCTRPTWRPTSACARDIRAPIAGGLPTVAECAGLLYLCDGRRVDGTAAHGRRDRRRRRHGTAADAVATARRSRPTDNLLARPGERVTGHEFHRTHLTRSQPRRRRPGS